MNKNKSQQAPKSILSKIGLNILFILLFSCASFAQNKYWVQFSDEWCASEDYSSCELPAEWKAFSQQHTNIEINYRSRWLNLISVTIPDSLVFQEIMTLPFVASVTKVKELYPQNLGTISQKEYAFALEQINATYLLDSMKLNGKGVKIGVIDGGFMKADEDPALKDISKSNGISYFKDYLSKENEDPFYGRKIFHDDHGTDVLKMIAGYDQEAQIQYGMATEANYYLARTDHGRRENRKEEDNWLEAVENFHQMGVRLVNSSLGYTDGFDKKRENHKVKEVDGQSTIITRAAQKAAEKGMLLVISAGNDGANKNWETLSLPADARDVLTVGASRFDEWTKIYYSSTGPEEIGYVKPDIACFAAEGTSFSAPVITGLAACIWQYDSTLTNYEVMNLIKQSGHLALAPNNYLGHGIPDGKKIMQMLEGQFPEKRLLTIQQTGNTFELPLPEKLTEVVIFHKKDQKNVLSQESIEVEEGKKSLQIERKEQAAFTTVVSRDQLLIEIEWL